MRRMLPWLLIAIPLLYYFALLVGGAIYPGYSHVRIYASELGAAGAPYPAIFNVSVILAGIAAIGGAALLPRGLSQLGSSRMWSVLAAVALGLWGVSMVMGGLFPTPDDLHSAFGLGLTGPLIPLFLMLALQTIPGTKGMRWFLGLVFVASVAMLAIMFGAGALVTRENVGLWQRAYTFAGIPWLAIFGLWLSRGQSRVHD